MYSEEFLEQLENGLWGLLKDDDSLKFCKFLLAMNQWGQSNSFLCPVHY